MSPRRHAPTGLKSTLTEAAWRPLCPRCDAELRRMAWHRVRGGPDFVGYTVILSCTECRAMLYTLTGGGAGDVAMIG